MRICQRFNIFYQLFPFFSSHVLIHFYLFFCPFAHWTVSTLTYETITIVGFVTKIVKLNSLLFLRRRWLQKTPFTMSKKTMNANEIFLWKISCWKRSWCKLIMRITKSFFLYVLYPKKFLSAIIQINHTIRKKCYRFELTQIFIIHEFITQCNRFYPISYDVLWRLRNFIYIFPIQDITCKLCKDLWIFNFFIYKFWRKMVALHRTGISLSISQYIHCQNGMNDLFDHLITEGLERLVLMIDKKLLLSSPWLQYQYIYNNRSDMIRNHSWIFIG